MKNELKNNSENLNSEILVDNAEESSSRVYYTKPKTVEDIMERIEAIENYLLSDVRAGNKEESFMSYNGIKRSPGKFYGGTDNPITNTTGHRLNFDGKFHATQIFSKAFFYTSDIAEKQNIGILEDALEKVLSLKGVSFNWKNDNSKDVGLIAQDVKNAIPEAAAEIDGQYSVKPSALIAYLVESIRQLKSEIDELKNGKNLSQS